MNGERCRLFNPTFNAANECKHYWSQDDGMTCGLCKLPDMYRCIEDVTLKPIKLSHSSVQDFLTCHHLFYLKQIRGLTIRNQHLSNAIKMGQLWDHALRFALGDTRVNMQEIIDDYEIGSLEVMKVKCLYKAFKELGIKVQGGYEMQKKFEIDVNVGGETRMEWGNGYPAQLNVRGFYDRKYEDWFAENKMSGRPDTYLDVFFIQSQIGTYFMADEGLQSVVMEIVRTPELRMTRKEEDNAELYKTRLLQDILNRPSHYFVGYDSIKNTYGKRFWRTEFDIEELKGRYVHIFKEIHQCAVMDGWYKNDRACRNILPGIACDMLGACRYGKESDEVYTIREKAI